MKDSIICSNCGSSNDKENDFCNNCGARLDVAAIKSESIQQPQRVNQKQTKLKTTAKTESEVVFKVFAILGLIFGIISITVFSWLGWLFMFVWYIYYWFPLLLLGISLLGIIFSALGIRGYIVTGIMGLVLGGIASIAQTVIVGITIYYWIST